MLDVVNERINVYDLSADLVRTVREPEDRLCHAAYRMWVDSHENVVCVTYLGLKKIDRDGWQVFFLPADSLPRAVVAHYDLHLVGDTLFFTNDKHGVQTISPVGVVQDVEQTAAVIRDAEAREYDSLDVLTTRDPDLRLSESDARAFAALKERTRGLMIGDKFYSSSRDKMTQYFEEVRKVVPPATRLAVAAAAGRRALGARSAEPKMLSVDPFTFVDPVILGYDSDHNVYWNVGIAIDPWTVRQCVVVFTRFGDVIDMFQYGLRRKGTYDYDAFETSGAHLAIAPNGDVWFMRGDQSGYHFWKLERRW